MSNLSQTQYSHSFLLYAVNNKSMKMQLVNETRDVYAFAKKTFRKLKIGFQMNKSQRKKAKHVRVLLDGLTSIRDTDKAASRHVRWLLAVEYKGLKHTRIPNAMILVPR